jgi:hypothetical protein
VLPGPVQDASAINPRYASVDRIAVGIGLNKTVGLLALLLILILMPGGKKSHEIQGLIVTRDFVIPAGQSVTAVRDTMILASRRIQIYGTLFVSPGMKVSFRSPTVNVQGKIEHIPGLLTRLQIAMMSVKSFEQSIFQSQPPVPEIWPGRGTFGCNGFTRKSLAQTPPAAKSPPSPGPGN